MPASPNTPTDIRSALFSRRDPAQPFVTYVGPEGRMELSAASVANAAAKIANALVGEFDLEPGDSVGVYQPWHWQRVTWLIGIWSAGLTAVPGGGKDCALIIAGPHEAAEAASASATGVQVVSTHPFGMPLDAGVLAELPPGAEDVTLAVRNQPDQQVFVADHSTSTALDGFNQAQLLDRGRTWASEHPDISCVGLTPGVDQWWLPAIWPLVGNGSVVLAHEIDSGLIDAERIEFVTS